MANPQDMDQVARIAAKQMGVEAPAPQAAPQQAAPAPKPQPKEAPTTPQENASAKASPTTEGDKTQQQPVKYKVQVGGNERELTPQQISGTMERYRDLNYKHAQMKPVMDLAEKMMKAGNATPEQVAKFMTAAAKSMTKNAKMGRESTQGNPGVAQAQQPSSQPNVRDLNAEFKKYEDDNAISLPPGYREGMDRINRLEQQLKQQMAQMGNVLKNTQVGANAAQQLAKNAQQDHVNVIRQATSNNLDRAQRELGLPDTDARAFMQFSGERGYTAEDFSDYAMTRKVMQDFYNAKNSGELQRLQNMNQRRQAFMANAPQGAAANAASAAAKAAQPTDIQRMGAKAMSQALQMGRARPKGR